MVTTQARFILLAALTVIASGVRIGDENFPLNGTHERIWAAPEEPALLEGRIEGRQAYQDGVQTLDTSLTQKGKKSPAPPPASSTAATACANEGGTCECTGTVVFGPKSGSVDDTKKRGSKEKPATGSIKCNNGVFGDPTPGIVKQCWCIKDSGGSGGGDLPSCVSLKSAHGKYMVAESDGKLNANRNAIGSWEKWQTTKNSDGTWSFKSAHGKWMVAEADGKANANRAAVGSWEKFKVEFNGGKIALKGAHNKYVSAESNGDVNANRDKAAGWENFETISCDKPKDDAGSGGDQCRNDICDDIGGDCCAPGSEKRACKDPKFEVKPDPTGKSRWEPCVKTFGQDAVYKCCPKDDKKSDKKGQSKPVGTIDCSAAKDERKDCPLQLGQGDELQCKARGCCWDDSDSSCFAAGGAKPDKGADKGKGNEKPKGNFCGSGEPMAHLIPMNPQEQQQYNEERAAGMHESCWSLDCKQCGMSHKRGAKDQRCQDYECSEADLDLCCEKGGN